MTNLLADNLLVRLLSADGGQDGDHADDGHSAFGVHVDVWEVIYSILFLGAIFLFGTFASRFCKMPSLVGEMVAGIIFGPPLLNWVPNPEAFVMLGEIGLILLVLEAGIDIDLTTLKLIGGRGIIIAIIGSILPILFGFLIAYALGIDIPGCIAAGSAFGPTSLGIAMNILRSGNIINTPVGQLIVAAAVIDDMIALIILSQLSILKGGVEVIDIIVPVVSAFGYLTVGGYVAVFYIPVFLEKFVLNRFSPASRGKAELAVMVVFLVVLMAVTRLSRASHLMGAFLAGLIFCRSHELHHAFVSQYKRVMKWLLQIFFASVIGFQVPIKEFGQFKIIWKGAFFTLALAGKVLVGFLVPNFTAEPRFTGMHMRDCLVTGFSMAAEGEFAFVIAVYAVDAKIISKDIYSSVVLAVLFSTIVPPFLLRYTIGRYNKIAEDKLNAMAKETLDRLSLVEETPEADLENAVRSHDAVFLCIQTQSDTGWGLLHKIMKVMFDLKIDVIDHRSWNTRGRSSTAVNEIYAKDSIPGAANDIAVFNERVEEISNKLNTAINQGDAASIKVTRWYPGIVTQITEEIIEGGDNKTATTQKSVRNLSSLLQEEASQKLEQRKEMQTIATREKKVDEILQGLTLPDMVPPQRLGKATPRRRRHKMMSSPATGGNLWSDPVPEKKVEGNDSKSKKTFFKDFRSNQLSRSETADLVVGGELYHVHVHPSMLERLKKGNETLVLGDNDLTSARGNRWAASPNFETELAGLVRQPMSQIKEDDI